MANRATKTKIDSETRNFNDDWTLKYLSLPTLPNSKPMFRFKFMLFLSALKKRPIL